MKMKKRNILYLFLEERGITHEWLANEVKRKFKRSKKWTYHYINEEKYIDINDKIVFAVCLGVSYKEFNQ